MIIIFIIIMIIIIIIVIIIIIIIIIIITTTIIINLRELGGPNPGWSFPWVHSGSSAETASSGQSVMAAPWTHVKNSKVRNYGQYLGPSVNSTVYRLWLTSLLRGAYQHLI